MSNLDHLDNAMPIVLKYCDDIVIKDSFIMTMTFRIGITLEDISKKELVQLGKEFIFLNGENDIDVGYNCLYMVI